MATVDQVEPEELGMGAASGEARAFVPSASSPQAGSPVPASIPSAAGASALRKVAAQIRHRLSHMELRSNVSWPASSPAAKTSGYVISEVADWQLRQWLHIVESVAQGMSAGTAETSQKAQGQSPASPVGNADAPNPSPVPHD